MVEIVLSGAFGAGLTAITLLFRQVKELRAQISAVRVNLASCQLLHITQGFADGGCDLPTAEPPQLRRKRHLSPVDGAASPVPRKLGKRRSGTRR